MNHPIDMINVSIPVVSAIIERVKDGEVEVLVQTRNKPDLEPEYVGTFEIPAGWIHRYENVYEALKREVLEETGLKVKKIKPDIKTNIYSPKNDEGFAFLPFCCNQVTKSENGMPWIGFVFICEVEEGNPVPQEDEVGEIFWIKKNN